MSSLQKEKENKLNEMTPVQTRTVTIKPGEIFRVGKDGYTHIELNRRNTKNLDLEFFIKYNEGEKEGKTKWSSHAAEVLTHENKEHKLNLRSGKVTWEITNHDKKTDSYTIKITDKSNYKMK